MQAVGWLVISIMLAGCGGWRMQAQAPVSKPVPSKYQFDYTVTNAAPISLLRVFDDGGSTYFQFRSDPPEALVISAETAGGEAIIPHETMGNYALVRGVYRQSSIATANQPVVARKLGDIAPMANIGPVVLPKPVQQAAAPVNERVPVVGQEPVTTPMLTHTIRFARNSAQLGPRGRGDLAGVLAGAGRAAEIQIRVRPFYPNRPASVRLTEARAATVRSALSAAGVDASRIRIDTQAAAQPLIAEVVLRAAEHRSADQPSTATIVSAGPLLQAAEHRPSRPAMVATHLTRGANP